MLGEDSGLELARSRRPAGRRDRAVGGRDATSSVPWRLSPARPTARARYVCELVALSPGGHTRREAQARSTGQIALEPRGDEGFGFDPVFVPDGEERTVAELGDDWKARALAPRPRGASALRSLAASAAITGDAAAATDMAGAANCGSRRTAPRPEIVCACIGSTEMLMFIYYLEPGQGSSSSDADKGTPCARGTSTSAPSWHACSRAGGSSCSTPSTTRPRTERRSSRTRARRPSSADGSARRTSGCSARTRGSSWPLSAAARASRRRGGRPDATWSARWRLSPARRIARPATSASSSRSPPRAARRGVRGTLDGQIALESRGGEGFGFDPVFVPDGEERTVAELGDAWKAEHSHRALAAKALLRSLAASAARTGDAAAATDMAGAASCGSRRPAPARKSSDFRAQARPGRPSASRARRRANHQLSSAPSTMTFAMR